MTDDTDAGPHVTGAVVCPTGSILTRYVVRAYGRWLPAAG
jgi:hypothetical protein